MVKLPLIIHLISCFHFYRLPHCSKLQNAETPVNWLTVFTDGGGRAKKTALVRQHDGSWQEQVLCCTGLAQHLELQVFLSVFKRWTDFPVNIVTFSVCSRGDQKVLKDCKRKCMHCSALRDLYLNKERMTISCVIFIAILDSQGFWWRAMTVLTSLLHLFCQDPYQINSSRSGYLTISFINWPKFLQNSLAYP